MADETTSTTEQGGDGLEVLRQAEQEARRAADERGAAMRARLAEATREKAAVPGRAVADVRDLLARLVPPDGTSIHDLAGNAYKLPSSLSYRQQIAAGRELEALLGSQVGTRAVELLTRAWGSGDAASVVAAVAAVALDENMADALDRAFLAAYPAVAAEAAARNPRDGEPIRRPSDLFPVEELVAAFVPFVVGPAGRIVGMLAAVGAQEQAGDADRQPPTS